MKKAIIGLTLCAATMAACQEDPPPPPPPVIPEPSAAKTDAKSAPTARTGVPRISPETMKRYRVETCVFGSQGLRVARDAYTSSLAGKPPSPQNLPSLGEYPDGRPAPKQERVEGRPPALAAAGQLPFVRHVRACSIAKSLKDPAWTELDAAVLAFEEYASKLNKALLDASRYYQRNQWEKDDFARGKTIHEELTKLFPQLDAELDKLVAAFTAWYPEHTASPDKLDEAGQLAHDAANDARTLTLLLMAKERDDTKIQEGLAAIEKKRDALVKISTDQPDAAHPRVVAPKLIQFIDAAKEGHHYRVTSSYADLVEANQRALAQLLRKRGDMRGGNMPVRALKPRIGRELPNVSKLKTAPPASAAPKQED